MLSVSSMALAAVLDSACGTNMANINNCSAVLYNTGNCLQIAQYQKDRQGLNPMLSQMGVDMMPRDS